MKIGIDISQLAYPNTGVANYLEKLIVNLLKVDKQNEYILFFSSLRRRIPAFAKAFVGKQNFKIKEFRIPLSLLEFLWNRLHILPIEWFIGDVDIFITSDWTEPLTKKAIKATILYDLIVYKYPNETDEKIVKTQRRKLRWVKKEASIIFCISKSSKKDAMEVLGIEEKRLKVIYPGVN